MSFEGEFDYCYKGCIRHGMETWKAGTLNLFSAADMSSYSVYRKDSFQRQLAICFSEEYFRRLATQFPSLFSEVYERYEKGLPTQLFSNHRFCSPQLHLLINQIRCLRGNDTINCLLLEAKILEVLALIFETDYSSCQLSPTDKEKIIETRNILLQSYRNPPTLFQLALSVGTNEFKLKQGFRELFHIRFMESCRNLGCRRPVNI